MIKKQVLDALSTLGFIPEEIEDFGYSFEYEGLTLIYPVDNDDDSSVTLIAPGIFDISPDNRQEVVEAMLTLCQKMKYVQPNIMLEDKVWLNYQHYLGDNAVTPELVEHMIRVLAFSTLTFHKIINGDGNDD